MKKNENNKNWLNVYLSEIIKELESGKRPKGGVQDIKEGIPSVGAEHLNNQGGFSFNKIKYVPQKFAQNMNKGIIKLNDIVIVKDGATTGKTSFVGKDFPYKFAVTNEHVFICRLFNYVYPRWVFYKLFSESGKKEILLDFRGAAQGGISSNFINKVQIPLPPLPEQRAIVAKIEEIFSELDKGIENLKTVQLQLDVYKKSILKCAFEGKLTEEWRKKNKVKLQTAEKLLEQVKKEREKLYNKQLADYNSKKIKIKPRLPKEFMLVTKSELSKYPELPYGWAWGKIGNITLGVEYGTSAKSKITGKIPVLRMGNIQNDTGIFDWSDLVYTDDDEEINKYILNKEDVLFNRTNSPELVGKTAIYKGEQSAIFAGYLIRVNQIKSLVNAYYLTYFLNTHFAKVYGNSVKTDGVNQSNINGEKLINYPFPICSLEEQYQIVCEIEKRFSVVKKLEESICESLNNAEIIRQSVFKKAFDGNLLLNEELITIQKSEDWEPSEKLLEKIKSEKVNNVCRKKRKKEVTMPEELKKIIDLLSENSDPILAKDLWQLSVFKDDIDGFYANLKELIDKNIIEEMPRQGKESYIKLKGVK